MKSVAIFTGSLFVGCATAERLMPGLTMSNANVLAMLDTIDRIQIDSAQLAEQQGASQKVRAFAARIVHEHLGFMEATHTEAQRMHVTPQKPLLALALEQKHAEAIRELRTRYGTEFDQAYITYQITMHEQLIDLVQNTEELMDHPDLRQYLRYTRPNLLSHLSAARTVDRQLVALYPR